jgi:hypothetical protein
LNTFLPFALFWFCVPYAQEQQRTNCTEAAGGPLLVAKE